MNEIKRYYFWGIAYPVDDSKAQEHLQDQWVRWEDVEKLLLEQEDRYAEEMQLLDARLQRILAKENR